jgi:hypothetical protein
MYLQNPMLENNNNQSNLVFIEGIITIASLSAGGTDMPMAETMQNIP